MHVLSRFFMSGNFQPHGYCYQWNAGLVWLHVISDVLISLAYFTIPLVLLFFIRKRRDLPFSWMFALFGTFIIACGTTHIMEIWNLWHAEYWVAGVIKATTAVASVGTAILLARLMPQALALPSAGQWMETKKNLENEISERKHAGEILRQSDEKLRLLIQGVKDCAILMLDSGGRITAWNEGAERIKGYRAEEILGMHFSKFYSAVDLASGKPSRELMIAEQHGRFEEEGWRVRKDGSHFWAHVVITALRDEAGLLRGFGKVTRDITDRKKTEEGAEVRRKEMAQKNAQLLIANNELESFSYSVSHDLRTPLRAIDGFSHALLEDYACKLDEEAKNHLHRIRAATLRMGNLIDDLLSLARLSRASMLLQVVNVSALVTVIAGDLRKAQPEREVELHITDGLQATADAGLLRIALENLLGNAWKFTSKKSAARIEFGETECKGTTAFFLRDDGAGFDPAYADRLFGPFQRLHGTTEFEGTGIGLATVQRIIHRHNGHIWAESMVDHGATFYFTLDDAFPQGQQI